MSQFQPINPDSKPHYALLDGLRGVAALLVVWYHIFEGFQFAGGKEIIDFANHGYLAVDFFFILSGFVVGYAYDSRWGKTLTLGGFFKRRIIRLHPMVIMGTVIGAASFALSGFTRWDGSHATIGLVMLAMLCGMFMIPATPGAPREVRGNGEMFPLNGPCWSLFFEYIGNILYALVLRRLGTRLLAAVAILLGGTLTWFAIANVSTYGSIGVGWTIDQVNLWGGALRMLFPFTMGLLVQRIFKPIKKVRGTFWLCSLVLLILFHVPFIGSNGSLCLNGVFEIVCIALVFPAIVWIAASGNTTDAFSTKVCNMLGNLSYPLYMVHYPVMYLFYMWLIDTKQYTFAETWQVALAVYAISIALGYICTQFYDLPVRKWLAKKFK
ncbi:MAG: acyltransferase family protein [Muribaculaceae bacterium]